MKDDVQKYIYGTLTAFMLMVVVWVSFIYLNACGFSLTCQQAAPIVERTPIPTFIPATLPAPDFASLKPAVAKCQVAVVDLIGAWVSAGYPEKDSFAFTDVKGQACEATFKKDVQPFFAQSNLWYPGSLACITCHNSDLAKAVKNMDLSSYAGILAGSGRANGEAKGNDILGGGTWDKSLLYQMIYAPDGKTLINRPPMPFGRGADVPASGPIVYAGTVNPTGQAGPVATATLPPSNIARPSNPGGPGPAVDLIGNADSGKQIFASNCMVCHGSEGTGGNPNPGSTDGTIPELNPIDETLISPDYKTFATNLDLFLEHGSTPEGDSPIFQMPAWGDKQMLTPQQIADVIAYLISLNQ